VRTGYLCGNPSRFFTANGLRFHNEVADSITWHTPLSTFHSEFAYKEKEREEEKGSL
jgi:hypothetical protein